MLKYRAKAVRGSESGSGDDLSDGAAGATGTSACRPTLKGDDINTPRKPADVCPICKAEAEADKVAVR
jgi:hypothetical protein